MVGEDRIASHPSQRNNGTSVTSRRKQKWKVWATAWPHSTAIVHRPRLLSASIPSSHIHLNPVLYSTPLQHSPLSPPALRICTCLLHHFIFRITPAPSHYALPRSFYLPRLPYLQYIYPLYTPSIPSSHHCTFRLPSFPTIHPIDCTEDAPHAVRSPEVWGFIISHTLLSSPPSTELL